MGSSDPSQADLLALHQALLCGDSAARVALARLLLPALRRRFARRYDLEREDIDSLVGWAIAKYLAAPEGYEPGRGLLLAYLYTDIDGDIRNEVAKRTRRPEVPVPQDRLELEPPAGNPTVEDLVMERLDPLDLPRPVVESVLAAMGNLSAEEHEVLLLLADGVRSTQAYAEALGIAHLPVEQQRREVKRAKDRWGKRLGSIRDQLRQ